MPYENLYILHEKLGNNALSYEKRKLSKGENPFLTIPSLIQGSIEDVAIGDEVVFEEVEDGKVKSCKGLKHFIRLSSQPINQSANQLITIFDNHNHALYFWLEAIRGGILEAGFELIHIDEHSDLWENTNILDPQKAIEDPEYAWEYTNLSCNVGNYIHPALDVGIVGNIIRIENNHEVEKFMNYTPSKNSLLNLDLDFFAPEMDFIEEEKKIKLIQNLLPQVKCVTIATSPYFIDQGLAIEKLQMLLSHYQNQIENF